MIHAYNEIYLYDVMRNLGGLFDIAINELSYNPDEFANKFANSDVARSIEQASPNYLSGRSASELLYELLQNIVINHLIPTDRTPQYWAGWILAYTQWQLNIPFNNILAVIPFSELISLYHPYHEAAETKTVDLIRERLPKQCALKQMRNLRQLSQKELSILSGVKLRTIQSYEQGESDINKAEASTLYALANALDCSMEALINKIQ